jgi:hypothetical protein
VFCQIFQKQHPRLILCGAADYRGRSAGPEVRTTP